MFSFQKGLNSYIKRYAWKNARTEDLGAVLSEESGNSVNELMDSWTKQKGYPVVFAKHKGDELELEQVGFIQFWRYEVFLSLSPISHAWTILVCLQVSDHLVNTI